MSASAAEASITVSQADWDMLQQQLIAVKGEKYELKERERKLTDGKTAYSFERRQYRFNDSSSHCSKVWICVSFASSELQHAQQEVKTHLNKIKAFETALMRADEGIVLAPLVRILYNLLRLPYPHVSPARLKAVKALEQSKGTHVQSCCYI